ncbi:hypothetical protein [Brevibacterium jeotgali]|nr:hypothetical protein [Brevibacterium jeotgali]
MRSSQCTLSSSGQAAKTESLPGSCLTHLENTALADSERSEQMVEPGS